MTGNKVKIIEEIFKRFTDKAYPSKEALGKALLTRKLKIYLGVDPTGPHLHLGHATNLLILKKLQKLGHEIIFLIGDFTGRIGDPSDRFAARKPLTKKEIEGNLKTFKEQTSKLISLKGKNAATIKRNSEWYNKMNFEKVIKLAQNFTVQQMIERDMFQKRIKANKPIGLHEFFYPLMQGYDSVALNVDMEIGGTDQTFNMLTGRTLQKIMNKREKFVLTTKLLINPKTGNKLMNKSEGGLINLDDSPKEMFGKVMALPDETIEPVAELCTDMPMGTVKKLTSKNKNPRDAKLMLASEIVKLYHDEGAAREAQKTWIETFSKKELPNEAPMYYITKQEILSRDITWLVVNTAKVSKSQAWRLITGKAVEINNKMITNPKKMLANTEIGNNKIVRIGKHNFFKTKIK